MSSSTEDDIIVENKEGLDYLKSIDDKTIDLVLTDPPYITSSKTGMDELAKHKKKMDKKSKSNKEKFTKKEEEWKPFFKEFKKKEEYIKWMKKKLKSKSNYETLSEDEKKKKIEQQTKKIHKTMKEHYLKYGSIYGKKYAVVTDYGEWDKNFTLAILEEFVATFYNKLREGGTMIIFFDLWKIGELKTIMEKYKFKQIRFIEWIKTNPQPLNSKVNYLTNCREIALLGVKKGSPTFNSKYDKGIYEYPIQGGKNKFHPTQKNLKLFENLIEKHSSEGDTVLDTFLGSGTTAIASKNTKRNFKGCEVSKEYYDKIIKILKPNEITK